MSVLRIFLVGEGACDWTLRDHQDDRGRPAAADAGARHGENTPYGGLPRAAQYLVIVPAARMRTLAVAVPPTPAAKLSSVVRFALEDQLAGDVESQHVVIAARRERDAIVHVLDRGWLRQALADLARQGVRPALVAAESDLAPRAAGALATWVWREDGGFLVETGGRVTVLDQSRDALPSGLLLALRNTGNVGNTGSPVPRVVVCGPPALAERSAAWSRATGVTFEVAPEWTWRDAPASTSAAVANLLTPELHAGSAPVQTAAGRPRALRLALLWLLAALLLHVGASAAEWGLLRWRATGVERDTRQLIKSAAPDLVGDLDAAWRKHYAGVRHRQGKTTPDDALPLLADAAAGLAQLPAGALRAINFETGQLTLDFDRAAADSAAAAMPVWQRRGLSVIKAESPGGLRLRFARQ